MFYVLNNSASSLNRKVKKMLNQRTWFMYIDLGRSAVLLFLRNINLWTCGELSGHSYQILIVLYFEIVLLGKLIAVALTRIFARASVDGSRTSQCPQPLGIDGVTELYVYKPSILFNLWLLSFLPMNRIREDTNQVTGVARPVRFYAQTLSLLSWPIVSSSCIASDKVFCCCTSASAIRILSAAPLKLDDEWVSSVGFLSLRV